jgi:hypothetical protein
VWWTIVWLLCAGFLFATLFTAIGYMWGRSNQIKHNQSVQDLMNDVQLPQQHRIRTAESDPNSQAVVRTARLRAYRTRTPPPRG